MGKGTIVNHIADGKYNVTLKIDDTRAQQAITDLDTAILQLNTIITELAASRGTAWAMYDSAKAKLNVIISQYVAGTATKKQVVAATADMNAKYRLYIEYDRAWWHAQLRQKSLEKRKEYIQNKLTENPEPTIEAWCADLTEDLSGNVGTIEIPNERTNDVQIRPGYDGEAVYNASRDGQLQQVVSSTAAGIYYNYAMFPGWQKWKPTYRVGKITAKPTTDTAHVLLDDATSSAQGLDVNVSNTLNDVPIVYMDCNGQVFEVDDRVVVEFIAQDHTDPQIIGFEANPKACELDLISIISGSGASSTNIHAGLTGTIDQTCIPLGDPNKYDLWWGCTFTGTDFIAYNWTQKWVVVFDGVETNICNLKIIYPLLGYTKRAGIAYNGTYLITVDTFLNTIDVFNISLVTPYTISHAFSYVLTGFSVYAMCWDFIEGDLIVGGSFSAGTPFDGRIRRYTGLTNVLKDEIIYPTIPSNPPVWNSVACQGLTMKGTDLITWGGRHAQTPPINETIRVHDGFSTTIKQTEPYSPTGLNFFDIIVYPKNG